MIQDYSKYNTEDQLVWETLFARQIDNLQRKSCSEYYACLSEVSEVLNSKEIPHFSKLNNYLMNRTEWSIEVVPGLIPVEDFFTLLAKRKFSASTWVRKMHQLDYLEEPDMFHDVFGHIPLLGDSKFAQFMEDFGKLGVENLHNQHIIDQLQRLYWFTIEFGLIQQNGRKVYGAGICSSFGETNHSLSNSVKVRPFSIEEVINTEFRTDVVQTLYFELDSFDQLFKEFDSFKKRIQPA